MPRWLTRLLILGIVVAVVAVAVNRFMNREEDFDEYEDIDAGFEFQETPVEIDVPAEEIINPSTATTEIAAGTATTTAEEAGAPSLIDINGIGPAYEARLNAMGINSMQDLVNANAEEIATQIAPIGGVAEVQDWQAQARNRAS